jgi:hypothetical protein
MRAVLISSLVRERSDAGEHLWLAVNGQMTTRNYQTSWSFTVRSLEAAGIRFMR